MLYSVIFLQNVIQYSFPQNELRNIEHLTTVSLNCYLRDLYQKRECSGTVRQPFAEFTRLCFSKVKLAVWTTTLQMDFLYQ